MRKISLNADFVVVGGGLAGMCAAIAAARRGVETVLIQDRPMPGGNASSEIRMWICGSREYLETGIVEELRLENFRRNPGANYSIWDSVLFEKVRFQKHLTSLFNTSCTGARMSGSRIASVRAWQLTTYTEYEISAPLFADCSGDSVLAEPTGAHYRVGHEARAEFNESIAPVEADSHTMGMSCLIQARESSSPKKFIPPSWAYTYPDDASLPHRDHDFSQSSNFWYLELGGMRDSIHDTEEIRDELLKTAFGLWDHIKNHGEHRAENWELDWVGFLPGKRESRRYVGDYIVTQHDIASGGRFDDLVAYGGWTMDDHHPAGFAHPGEPTIFHPAPTDFGIPFRALYSENIENLYFAGRNISVTHVALSAARVIATCAVMGEAVGLAASFGVPPREVYRKHLRELQKLLLDNGCYLPGHVREIPRAAASARLAATSGDASPLRNGVERVLPGQPAAYWQGGAGDAVTYTWERPLAIDRVRIVLDSDLERRIQSLERLNMLSNIPLVPHRVLHTPETLVEDFDCACRLSDGTWQDFTRVRGNAQRLVCLAGPENTVTGIRLTLRKLRGSSAKVFAFDFEAADAP